ncbi:Skp1 domain-containing protein [Heracleum sosnowskyi]|uniref:Skp1 domain-containing protein n=1 Tax=Heracleum sosnowskyi TaxID=360622 RepID=A0AAD8N149_9APIA|nr:Skp1 domain-containing protein [Heracleum sosnowskyi]
MSNNLVASTMSKAESEVKKPETMKSYVWVQTGDGFTQAVEQEVAILCPTFDHEIKSGFGSSKDNPISVLPRVRATSLVSVFDYCRFHKVRRSFEEHKTFDENFLQVDARSLCELITLAHYLQLEPLIYCTCIAMAQRISSNSTEEIWHMLNLSDDLPEVEKLESGGHSAYDSRIRLLEKLYKKKKQTVLKEIENLKNFMAGLKPGEHEDTRQVDDLVSFINGGDGDTQNSKKKKNRKKRAQKKISSSIASPSSEASASKIVENHDKDSNDINSANGRGSPADALKLYGIQDESFNVKNYFDDNDMDPAIREAIRRELVEFARRLNLNYADLI